MVKENIINEKSLLLKAVEFASQRHRRQFRKGFDKTPYINHPIEVSTLLANEGGENDIILLISALLHDVVEDTVNTIEEKNQLIKEISNLFGEAVLSLVLEVTDDKSLEKKERKRLQIENASHKSSNAKKLKIADKITNLRDITYNPPHDWSLERIIDYIDWCEKVVAGLRGVNKDLEELFDVCLVNAKSKFIKK